MKGFMPFDVYRKLWDYFQIFSNDVKIGNSFLCFLRSMYIREKIEIKCILLIWLHIQFTSVTPNSVYFRKAPISIGILLPLIFLSVPSRTLLYENVRNLTLCLFHSMYKAYATYVAEKHIILIFNISPRTTRGEIFANIDNGDRVVSQFRGAFKTTGVY